MRRTGIPTRSPGWGLRFQSSATGTWQTVIGLEIHAQIRTGAKLFSRELSCICLRRAILTCVLVLICVASKTSHDEAINTNVHILDAAFPGTLPVLDHKAVRLSLKTALALGCNIVGCYMSGVHSCLFVLMIQNPRSTFDRKHYFYHDIPSSYQITQHYNPLARQGRLPIRSGEYGSTRDLVVGINQVQIEQVSQFNVASTIRS